MKFTCTVDIKAPLNRVVELFDNTDNLRHWQEGFVSYDHLMGQPGSPGAQARFVYQHGRNRIELIETIQVNNLPEEFTALYEHKHMVNTMSSRFHALDDQHTRYEAEIEYKQFLGLIPKLMARLMPGMFRKQTQKWLDRFQVFAEQNA